MNKKHSNVTFIKTETRSNMHTPTATIVPQETMAHGGHWERQYHSTNQLVLTPYNLSNLQRR